MEGRPLGVFASRNLEDGRGQTWDPRLLGVKSLDRRIIRVECAPSGTLTPGKGAFVAQDVPLPQRAQRQLPASAPRLPASFMPAWAASMAIRES